jgi:hypothetical protein
LTAPRLPRGVYPSAAAWESDVAQVVEWVKYGVSYLDPYATILGVERFLDRTYYPEDGSGPIPLGVVIDLLMLRMDSNGRRFIEILDYKTGKHLDGSLFVPVFSRFVLKRLVDATLPGENFAPVVFTELYVAKRHVRTSELTLERCLADWEEVKRTLAAIAAESTWDPTPPHSVSGARSTAMAASRRVRSKTSVSGKRTPNNEGPERSRPSLVPDDPPVAWPIRMGDTRQDDIPPSWPGRPGII